MTPDDPRHGSPAGYRAGCKKSCCRTGIARYNERRRLALLAGRPTTAMVPALGTQRRIQALAALGWSFAAIGAHAHSDKARIRCLLHQQRITPVLAARISATYDQLAMRVPAGYAPSIGRVRNRAAALGWAPPLAWEGLDLNDPAARPIRGGRTSRDDVDQVVIQRILDGDPGPAHLATPAERRAVVAAWIAGDRPLSDLGRLTGWKPERYGLVNTREAA